MFDLPHQRELDFCKIFLREMKLSSDVATVRKSLCCEEKLKEVILGQTFASVGHSRSLSLQFFYLSLFTFKILYHVVYNKQRGCFESVGYQDQRTLD